MLTPDQLELIERCSKDTASSGILIDFIEELLAARQQAEAARRDSEIKFRQFFEQSNDGMAITDEQGHIIEWNPALERLTGIPAADTLGRFIWDIQYELAVDDVRSPALYQRMQALMQRILEQGDLPQANPGVDIQIRNRNDGSTRDVHMMRFPIPTARGFMLCSIARDFTERKRAEALAVEQERLETALHHEQEITQLQKHMMLRIAHEFRTPLTVIQTSSEILNRYMDRLTTEKRLDHFRQIRRQIAQLTNMLNDAAYVMKADNLTTFRPALLDWSHLIEVVTETFASGWPEHRLEYQTDGSLDNLIADSHLVQLIINGLLSNGAKYSERGSTVHLRVKAEPETLLLQVRDEGTGILPADQEQIYDLFYRGSNTGNVSGLGLGLHLVKRAVETHQGSISFETAPSDGTAFTVRLPVARPPSAAARG